ncbi:MAG: hypothetical protein Q8R92_03475 [Deltaproteobacteria bacterium]|nr:hypothetical protein [Deltaproteobacteria bacterium]
MSSPVPVWHAMVRDGRLDGLDRQRLAAYLERLEGIRVELVIRRTRARRSTDQNRYWWGVVVPRVAQHVGESGADGLDRIHYALLACWRGWSGEALGQRVPRCTSSSRLTTAEFTALIDWARQWALTEFGVDIPEPGGVA